VTGYNKPATIEYLALLAIILLPNIVLVNSFSGLIHDDAFQLSTTYEYSNKSWFGVTYYFNGFRENLLSHLAAFGSPLIARLFVIGVYLCGGAILLYQLLVRYLGAPKAIAFIAASVPYLTASIATVPNGINISYVAGDVFFTIISLIIIAHLLQRETTLLVFAPLVGVLFILVAETQTSGAITAPIVFVAAILIRSDRHVVRALLLVVLAYAVFHVLTGESGQSRKGMVSVGKAISNYGSHQLFGFKVTNPSLPNWLWVIANIAVAIGLVFAAIASIPIRDKSKNLAFYAWKIIQTPGIALCLLALAILIWSPVPYALTSSNAGEASQTRYYFTWLFGYWGLWATGVLYIAGVVISKLPINDNAEDTQRSFKHPIVFALSGIIATSFALHKSKAVPAELVENSALTKILQLDLRKSLGMDTNRQILLILDHPSIKWTSQKAMNHVSNPRAGLGLLNYALQPQSYAHGVVALPKQCSGIFDKWTANYGYYEVSGFKQSSPISVAKYIATSRQTVIYDYLLDFTSPEQGRLMSLAGAPEIIGDFTSAETLTALLSTKNVKKETVAFADTYLAGRCKFSDRGWSPTTP
jgi:hypothetical protein